MYCVSVYCVDPWQLHQQCTKYLAHLAYSTMCFYYIPGVYKLREAAALWELCHKKAVPKGLTLNIVIYLTVNQEENIF